MASDRANPRMAYENSCCFREGFLQTNNNSQYLCTQYVLIFFKIHLYQNKPSIADDQTTKHCPNASSGSSHSNCGSSSSNKLGSSINIPADGTGLKPPQCDLGERALWHHSNSVLYQENILNKLSSGNDNAVI